MRAEALEARFVDLLERTQPSRAYLRLVREDVLVSWQNRHQAAAEQSELLQGRIGKLKQRKARLTEAYLYEETIDHDTYRQQLDRLGRELTEAQVALDEMEVEDLDVPGLLDFADEVLADAAQTWTNAPPDTKRRFEQALYPDGVVYDPDEAFRTVPTPLVFRPLEVEEGGKSRLVARTGFEPVLPA
jgi:site-specific DNA recombinase